MNVKQQQQKKMCHQVSEVPSNGRQVNTWHDRKSVRNSTDDSSGACSNPRTQILTFLTFWQCKHRFSPLLKEHIPSDCDVQVLEFQLPAPPLSNLFLHKSTSSTTSCAIHLQMSLLIAVTTTRGLLKTRQVCGACWASLCAKILKHDKREGLLWIYYEQEHFDMLAALLFALQPSVRPEKSKRLCTDNLVSQHKQSHIGWVNYCWQQVLLKNSCGSVRKYAESFVLRQKCCAFGYWTRGQRWVMGKKFEMFSLLANY